MTEEQFQHIVAEVIRRLFDRMGAAGRNGDLIVVFTGATVALTEAVLQVRSLLLDGFRVRLVFSGAAEHLFGDLVKQQLNGFPGLGFLPAAGWLSSLKSARAVVVPLLSLNTASKLSALVADNLVSNILLHALLMGKSVIVARDGADPDGKGREELGFHKANGAMKQALRQRLERIEDYGCILTSTDRLADTVRSVAVHSIAVHEDLPPGREQSPSSACPSVSPSGRIATAGDVLHAHQKGASLDVGPSARVTPMARDLARQLGVALIASENR